MHDSGPLHQTDLRMPRRCLRILHDEARMAAVREAVQGAVAAARCNDNGGDDERDVRVLFFGSCAGLLALLALRAGARHVTCVER